LYPVGGVGSMEGIGSGDRGAGGGHGGPIIRGGGSGRDPCEIHGTGGQAGPILINTIIPPGARVLPPPMGGGGRPPIGGGGGGRMGGGGVSRRPPPGIRG
jgi:hypothetical protein